MHTIDYIGSQHQPPSEWYVRAMRQLGYVEEEFSQACDLDSVTTIVPQVARKLTKADGATLVLRDGGNCHYVEEHSMSPLWKGQHFPMETCISGWVMLNRKPVVIEDVYQDSRIPAAAYRPTFVKSLVMVPILPENPIGAIGNYWAEPRFPSEEELTILQALARIASVAMENIIKLHPYPKNCRLN
jgi:GAF domain-containing protein